MRIVIATTDTGTWGPQVDQVALAMRLQGHDVQTVSDRNLDAWPGGICDLLFCLGTGESLARFFPAIPARVRMLYLIESIPTLTERDDFTGSKLLAHRPYLNQFHHIFVHTRRSIPTLQTLAACGVEELLWPHFPAIYSPAPAVAKKFDLLFLGAPSLYRNQILGQLAARFNVATAWGHFHQQVAPALALAKIVLNIHFTPLPNFECRVAEVLGCGAFLMTEALEPADVLIDRKHLVVFDQSNVFALVEHFLQADGERQRVSEAGRAAIERYRVENQTARILEVARNLVERSATTS